MRVVKVSFSKAWFSSGVALLFAGGCFGAWPSEGADLDGCIHVYVEGLDGTEIEHMQAVEALERENLRCYSEVLEPEASSGSESGLSESVDPQWWHASGNTLSCESDGYRSRGSQAKEERALKARLERAGISAAVEFNLICA